MTLTDAPARGITLEQTLERAGDMHPDLIVIDTSTPSIEHDIRVAEKIKSRRPAAFVVLVGTHVSAMTDEVMASSEQIDAVARNEYEWTVLELAQRFQEGKGLEKEGLEKIQGLSWRSQDGVVHNADRPLEEDLDKFPWVSRAYKKHLVIGDYFNQNSLYPMITLTTSRGCPFKCTFCVYPQTMMGNQYRFRSIGDVMGELTYIKNEFPDTRCIFFEDDTLTANRKRCHEFADAMLESGIRIPWTANSRVEVDYETMVKLKKSGCRELCVGFESGSEKVLKKMRKGTSVEKMNAFMKNARRANLLIHGCFMFGFPGEEPEDVKKTMELAVQLRPDTAQFYPVMVYPGTAAYDEYKQNGWLQAARYADWLTSEGLHSCVIRNEHYTAEELVRLCDEARKKFYLRPQYLAYKTLQMLSHPKEIKRTVKAGSVFFKHLFQGSKV